MSHISIMEVCVQTSDRRIIQHGTTRIDPRNPTDQTAVGARDGCVVEEVSGRTYVAILNALYAVVGDGGVVLSADHQTITVEPPSAAWRDAQGATAAHQLQQEAEDAALAAALVNLLPADAAQALTRRLGLA